MRRLVVLLALTLGAPGPARASTPWVRVPIAEARANLGAGASAIGDGRVHTGWRGRVGPGRPAVIVARLGAYSVVKGLRLHMGPLPAGIRCRIEVSRDGRRYATAQWIDGPRGAGWGGVGLNDWLEGAYVQITIEALGRGPGGHVRLDELEVFSDG